MRRLAENEIKSYCRAKISAQGLEMIALLRYDLTHGPIKSEYLTLEQNKIWQGVVSTRNALKEELDKVIPETLYYCPETGEISEKESEGYFAVEMHDNEICPDNGCENCWQEPEEQLAFSKDNILNILLGPSLHGFLK